MFKKTYSPPRNQEMRIEGIPEHISQKIVTWLSNKENIAKRAIAKKLNSTDANFFYQVSEPKVGIVTPQKEYLALKLFAAMCQELSENFKPFKHVTSRIEEQNSDSEVNIKILSSVNNINLRNYLPWESISQINDIIKIYANEKNLEELLEIDSSFAEALILSPLQPVFGSFSKTAVEFFGEERLLKKALHAALLVELDYKPAYGFLKTVTDGKTSEASTNRPEECFQYDENSVYSIKIPRSLIQKINQPESQIAQAITESIEKNLKPRIEQEIKNTLESNISDVFEPKIAVTAEFKCRRYEQNENCALLDICVTPTVQLSLTPSEKIMNFIKNVAENI